MSLSLAASRFPRTPGGRCKVAASFIDAGKQNLKNIARPMRIYRLNLTPKAAQEIIAALKIKLSASEKMRIAAGGTKNVDAHDFFLKGRELVTGNKRDREMFVDANVFLRRAIKLDPNYAAALEEKPIWPLGSRLLRL